MPTKKLTDLFVERVKPPSARPRRIFRCGFRRAGAAGHRDRAQVVVAVLPPGRPAAPVHDRRVSRDQASPGPTRGERRARARAPRHRSDRGEAAAGGSTAAPEADTFAAVRRTISTGSAATRAEHVQGSRSACSSANSCRHGATGRSAASPGATSTAIVDAIAARGAEVQANRALATYGHCSIGRSSVGGFPPRPWLA